MTDVANQKLWRKIFQNTASDLLVEVHKPSPAIADIGAIEEVIEKRIAQDAIGSEATITGDAVPGGKLWAVTTMSGYNSDGATRFISLRKILNATRIIIEQRAPADRWDVVSFHGFFILDDGETLQAYFDQTAGATNNCRFYYTAYQIDKY